MKGSRFKLLLGGIALTADSFLFDSFISKIKEELLILCISLSVLSLIYLAIRKIMLHKNISMSKAMGVLVISIIVILSMGLNYLISPKEKAAPINSLIRPNYYLPKEYIKYADLGLEDAQVFAFDMYREDIENDHRIQDNTKALDYAILASMHGDKITLLNTAYMYYDGLGTETNYERAYFFAKLAEKKGNFEATNFINHLISSKLIDIQVLKDMENYELKKDTSKIELSLKEELKKMHH